MSTLDATSRRLWWLLLVVWCLLALVWMAFLVARPDDSVSHGGSLALALGSGFLAIWHLDSNARRRRSWMVLAWLLIGAAWVLLYFATRAA